MKIILDDTEKKILTRLQHGAELCSFPRIHGPRWCSNHETVDATALRRLVKIGFVNKVHMPASVLVPPSSGARGMTLYVYEYIPKKDRPIK